MEIKDLLLPKYRETFPKDLLHALLRYVAELSGAVGDIMDGDIKDDYQVWSDYDLTLHKDLLGYISADVLDMPPFQAFEIYGECEVLSYKMYRWLETNVPEYDSMPLKLLSIIDLKKIPKSDAVIVRIDKKNECLSLDVDLSIIEKEVSLNGGLPVCDGNQSLGYFTWPEELLPLYEK